MKRAKKEIKQLQNEISVLKENNKNELSSFVAWIGKNNATINPDVEKLNSNLDEIKNATIRITTDSKNLEEIQLKRSALKCEIEDLQRKKIKSEKIIKECMENEVDKSDPTQYFLIMGEMIKKGNEETKTMTKYKKQIDEKTQK